MTLLAEADRGFFMPETMVKEGRFDLLVIGHSQQNMIVDSDHGHAVEAFARLAPCSVLMATW
jgi:hypothetical protein